MRCNISFITPLKAFACKVLNATQWVLLEACCDLDATDESNTIRLARLSHICQSTQGLCHNRRISVQFHKDTRVDYPQLIECSRTDAILASGNLKPPTWQTICMLDMLVNTSWHWKHYGPSPWYSVQVPLKKKSSNMLVSSCFIRWSAWVFSAFLGTLLRPLSRTKRVVLFCLDSAFEGLGHSAFLSSGLKVSGAGCLCGYRGATSHLDRVVQWCKLDLETHYLQVLARKRRSTLWTWSHLTTCIIP